MLQAIPKQISVVLHNKSANWHLQSCTSSNCKLPIRGGIQSSRGFTCTVRGQVISSQPLLGLDTALTRMQESMESPYLMPYKCTCQLGLHQAYLTDLSCEQCSTALYMAWGVYRASKSILYLLLLNRGAHICHWQIISGGGSYTKPRTELLTSWSCASLRKQDEQSANVWYITTGFQAPASALELVAQIRIAFDHNLRVLWNVELYRCLPEGWLLHGDAAIWYGQEPKQDARYVILLKRRPELLCVTCFYTPVATGTI